MPNLGVRYRGLMGYWPSEIRELVWTPEARAAARLLSTDAAFQETWDARSSMSPLDSVRARNEA